MEEYFGVRYNAISNAQGMPPDALRNDPAKNLEIEFQAELDCSRAMRINGM
jgi:hypothetical protein